MRDYPMPMPFGWFQVGWSDEVPAGESRSAFFFDRHLVIWRDEGGAPHVWDAFCPHLGAHLGHGGTVDGDALRCPFHGWLYAADGRCLEVPVRAEPPAFARAFAYPTEERYGLVWVFNGPRPLFPLPSFERWPDEALRATPIRPKPLAVHPHVITMNGLDVQHFRAVHGFRFTDEPVVEEPSPFSTRVRMQIEVTRDNLFLRALRLLSGPRVDGSVTTWGGNVAVIEAMAGPIPFLMFNTHVPRPDGSTLSRTVLFRPRLPWWKRLLGLEALLLVLAVAIMLYLTRDDVRILERLRFRPRLIEVDAGLRAFVRQTNRLPCFDPEARERAAETEASDDVPGVGEASHDDASDPPA